MQSDSAAAAAPQPRTSTLTPVALLAMTFGGWPPRPSRHCIRQTSLCNRSSSMRGMTAVAPDLKRWITACMCMFPILQTFIIQNRRYLAKSSLLTFTVYWSRRMSCSCCSVVLQRSHICPFGKNQTHNDAPSAQNRQSNARARKLRVPVR
jgi:hypothetical protein